MKRNNLIAYAQSFASFLLNSGIEINNIIIFGSVAKNEFDKESDIDIYIDTKEKEDDIMKQFRLFELSQFNKIWRQKGIKNPISLHIGNLEKSPLRQNIISSGIQIYGKFKQMPKKVEYYLLFALNFTKLKRNDKIRVWRKLYGYRQKTGKKTYEADGLVKQLRAKRIEKNIMLIPAENKEKIINFMKKNGIGYKFYEVWTEEI